MNEVARAAEYGYSVKEIYSDMSDYVKLNGFDEVIDTTVKNIVDYLFNSAFVYSLRTDNDTARLLVSRNFEGEFGKYLSTNIIDYIKGNAYKCKQSLYNVQLECLKVDICALIKELLNK